MVDRRRSQAEQVLGRVTPPLLLALGLAYAALGWAIWQLADPSETGAPWWPAAGLTLGVLCRVRRADWPAVVAVVFFADLAIDLLQGAPLATSLAWATANAVEPVLGALALRCVFRGQMPNLESPRNVFAFFAVAAVAGPPLASLIGATASAATFDDQALLETWRTWYVGDVLGIIVVAPVVLYSHQLRKSFDLRLAILLMVSTAVTLAVFLAPSGTLFGRAYFVGPMLAVVALSYGTAGGAIAGLLMAVAADVVSASGRGPFALTTATPEALLELQLFTAVQLLTVYLLASVRAQMLTATARAARLSEEQLRDPLTRVGNRLRLEQALVEVTTEPVVGTAVSPAAAILLDLDDFKPINDEFGHAAGDEVLRIVADRIRRTVRESDVVARIGGDEFAIVCPAISEADAQGLVLRLRNRLSAPMSVAGETLSVGVSIGLSWIPEPTGTSAELLRAADLDMYRMKAAHRSS